MKTQFAKRVAIPKPSESKMQTELFKLIRLREKTDPRWRVIFSIPNGGKRDAVTGARMKAEGVRAGVWDIFVPVQNEISSGLWIEMKAGKNKLTDNQIKFKDDVEKANFDILGKSYKSYDWEVCYSAVEAYNKIERYFNMRF